MGIMAPALIIIFFSFVFGNETIYKVGVIDNDDTYISKEIIKSISKIENVEVVDLDKDNYEIQLASHQIQIVIIIPKNFSHNILNLINDEIKIKSITNSDVKESLVSIIKSKSKELNIIAKLSNKDMNEFISLYEKNINKINITTNYTEKERPSIINSIGLVIMIIFITGSSISSFLIEDEENNTKARILASGISLAKYNVSMFIVFYILSCLSTIIYFFMCKVFNINFNMINSNNFLIVMLFLNMISISLNLCIVSFTKNRYVANTVNILIVIPSCMLSGVFWDFNVMPTYLQTIGRYLPSRWVYECIEILGQYNSIIYIKQYLLKMIILSLIFIMISFIVKDKKEYRT